MPMNPNSIFVRHIFDAPTDLALKFDAIVRASGKSKKQYFVDMMTAEVARHKSPRRKK